MLLHELQLSQRDQIFLELAVYMELPALSIHEIRSLQRLADTMESSMSLVFLCGTPLPPWESNRDQIRRIQIQRMTQLGH